MRANPITCTDDGYRFWVNLCPHLVGKDDSSLKNGAFCPCCENSVAAPSHLCDRCAEPLVAAANDPGDDRVRWLERSEAEQRNEAIGWRRLFDAEATERRRLERGLVAIWELPPSPDYHDQVGQLARRTLEPGIGVIDDALRGDAHRRPLLSRLLAWESRIRRSSTHPWDEPVANLLRECRDTLALDAKESPAEAGLSVADGDETV